MSCFSRVILNKCHWLNDIRSRLTTVVHIKFLASYGIIVLRLSSPWSFNYFKNIYFNLSRQDSGFISIHLSFTAELKSSSKLKRPIIFFSDFCVTESFSPTCQFLNNHSEA